MNILTSQGSTESKSPTGPFKVSWYFIFWLTVVLPGHVSPLGVDQLHAEVHCISQAGRQSKMSWDKIRCGTQVQSVILKINVALNVNRWRRSLISWQGKSFK